MATCDDQTFSVPSARRTVRRVTSRRSRAPFFLRSLLWGSLLSLVSASVPSWAILPNQNPLALSRPGLRPTSPFTKDGDPFAIVSGWSNTYNRYGDGAIIDSELRTVELRGEVPLTSGLSLRGVLPFHWIGGGVLDHFIEEWDSTLGVPNRARERGVKDRLLLKAPGEITQDGFFSGGAQGEVQLDLYHSEVSSLSLYGGLRVPLQGGELSQGSIDPFVGFRGRRTVGPVAFSFGAQGAYFTERDLVQYTNGQLGGFFSVGAPLSDSVRLVGIGTVSSALIENVQNYPDMEVYLDLGGEISLPCGTLQLFIRENPYRTDETSDVSFIIGYGTHF